MEDTEVQSKCIQWPLTPILHFSQSARGPMVTRRFADAGEGEGDQGMGLCMLDMGDGEGEGGARLAERELAAVDGVAGWTLMRGSMRLERSSRNGAGAPAAAVCGTSGIESVSCGICSSAVRGGVKSAGDAGRGGGESVCICTSSSSAMPARRAGVVARERLTPRLGLDARPWPGAASSGKGEVLSSRSECVLATQSLLPLLLPPSAGSLRRVRGLHTTRRFVGWSAGDGLPGERGRLTDERRTRALGERGETAMGVSSCIAGGGWAGGAAGGEGRGK